MGTFFILVFPHGDLNTIAVAEISHACDHEIHDYTLASVKRFDSSAEANKYCRELAIKHSKKFVLDDDDLHAYCLDSDET